MPMEAEPGSGYRFWFRWRFHVFLYLFLITVVLPVFDYLVSVPSPRCGLHSPTEAPLCRVFDCFLYHSESYMLYLHLLTLWDSVDHFVIGSSNYSFANNRYSPVSFAPFNREIAAFAGKITFLDIDFLSMRMSDSKYGNATAWRREATARNHLLRGVNLYRPAAADLIMLCDVDELVTRRAVLIIRTRPPVHYYNIQGMLFHYSFRWHVSEWERPLVIRYGSLSAPLDDYKFMPFLTPLNGIFHYHCSFCFPRLADVIRKLESFSHTEFSVGKFADPNYVYARIACGYGVLPSQWKMPERLTLVPFDSDIFLPKDRRFNFMRERIGFVDLNKYTFNITAIREFMPRSCPLKHLKFWAGVRTLI
jgi:hypothetical protein